jgi:hypothetical protein
LLSKGYTIFNEKWDSKMSERRKANNMIKMSKMVYYSRRLPPAFLSPQDENNRLALREKNRSFIYY